MRKRPEQIRTRPIRSIVVACFLAPALLMGQDTRVLFIGNSYTYYSDLPAKFISLAAAAGKSVTTGQSTPPGYSLEQHWNNSTTLNLIREGDWDFVVLQEQSQRPAFPDAQVQTQVLPYAQRLADSVRTYNPCAEVVYYMTWGRENGDQMNCFNWPPVCTYEGMQERLRNAYVQMAEANDGWCAPVGMAWWKVRQDHPQITLYDPDGSHPSLAGTFLAASTIYSTVFRTSCADLVYSGGLSPDVSGILRSIASATVLDSLETWNIGVLDPVAEFTYDVTADLTIDLTSLSPGDLFHWWDLGDGNTATGASVQHTYGSAGYFEVVHAVTDACGRTDSTTQMVTNVINAIAGTWNNASHAWTWHGDHACFQAPQGGGILHLFGPDGRETLRLWPDAPGGDRTCIPAPGAALVWSWSGPDGSRLSGRLPLRIMEGR